KGGDWQYLLVALFPSTFQNWRKRNTQPISPLEGEMSGRTERGAVPPASPTSLLRLAQPLGLVEIVLADDDRRQQHQFLLRLGLVLGVGDRDLHGGARLLAGELFDRAGELAVADCNQRFRQRVEAVDLAVGEVARRAALERA